MVCSIQVVLGPTIGDIKVYLDITLRRLKVLH